MEDKTTNDELLKFMKEQFEGVSSRMDSGFNKSDGEFEKMGSRLKGLENRIDALSLFFNKDALERIHTLETKVEELMTSK